MGAQGLPHTLLIRSPVMGGDQLGWVPEVLFEAQLKGLANGADDILSKPFGTLQNVAGWGHSRVSVGCQEGVGTGVVSPPQGPLLSSLAPAHVPHSWHHPVLPVPHLSGSPGLWQHMRHTRLCPEVDRVRRGHSATFHSPTSLLTPKTQSFSAPNQS